MNPPLDPGSKDLYRLPWSLNESPIGWVEVTDLCNIHCKGCYRARKSGHKTISTIIGEIEFLPHNSRVFSADAPIGYGMS